MRFFSSFLTIATATCAIVGLMVPAARAQTFAAKVDYPAGTNPYGVAVDDFNGDGKRDLATANSGSSTVSVLLGKGDGTFSAKVDYATGSNPYTVAVGDFNGDGKSDLATANYNDNTMSVLLGNGDGTFAAKVDYTTDTRPFGVAAGDFNGDGKGDLATANSGSTTVSVFVGKGDGTFATKVDYTTGTSTSPRGIAVGDFNGDGKSDLVTASFGISSASVLLNNGDGTFAAGVKYTAGSTPYGVAVGDLNGDGKSDIAVGNTSSTVSVLRNNGDGTFAAKVDYTTGTNPYTVAVGDFNGDGRRDLVAANFGSSTVSVFLNTTTPYSPTVVTGTASAITATGATIGGTVNPNGVATTAQFEYGATTAYGSNAPVALSPADGTSAQSVSATLTGLTANTLYHYRLSATNSLGTSTGGDATFTTAAMLPATVTTGAASGLTTTGATIGGTVNPNGMTTTAQFQYGLTTSYGSTSAVTLSPADGKAAQTVSAAVTGLSAHTLYHYRLSATNSAGTTNGADATFTTSNSVPMVSSVSIAPGSPNTSSVLAAVPVASDADGDALTYSYQWLKNTVALAGETNSTLDLSKAGNGDEGDSITVTASDAFGGTSAAQTSPAVTVGGNTAPTVVSLTPASAFDAVGASRTFTVTVNDANGAGDIKTVWLLTNTRLDWSDGVTLFYDRAANAVYLRDVEQNKFIGPITPGAAGTLSTRNVSLDGAGIVVTPGSDGTSLSLSFPLVSKIGLIGSNTLWGRVEDNLGAVDPAAASGYFGFVQKGRWSVDGTTGTQQPPVLALAPGAKGTSTNLTAGSEFTLTVDLSDPNSLGDVRSVYVLVNKPGMLDWSYGLTLFYEVRTGRLYLRSDDGSGFLGGQIIGQSNGTLENEAGSIRLDGCTATPIKNGVRLSLAITPKGALAGTRQVWSRIEDRVSNTAEDADAGFGFKTEGTWVVGRGQTLAPSPSASVQVAGQAAGKGTSNTIASGQETTFTLTLNDSDGVGQLDRGWILINTPGKLDWAGGITLVLDARTNTLYLRSSDGGSWSEGLVGSPSSLENSAVSVRLSGCTIARSGQTITLSIKATPKAGYVGTKQIWSRVNDVNGQVQAGQDDKLGFNTEGTLNITNLVKPAFPGDTSGGKS